MLLEPPVEELVDIVGNKYKLCNLAARRANEIQKKNLTDHVESKENDLSVATQEVYDKKIIPNE